MKPGQTISTWKNKDHQTLHDCVGCVWIYHKQVLAQRRPNGSTTHPAQSD